MRLLKVGLVQPSCWLAISPEDGVPLVKNRIVCADSVDVAAWDEVAEHVAVHALAAVHGAAQHVDHAAQARCVLARHVCTGDACSINQQCQGEKLLGVYQWGMNRP